jgi:hypothetical protein
VFFAIATFLFVKGYRDVDTALNLYIVKQETGVEFVDVGLFGKEFTIKELYVIGIIELLFSFIFFLLSVGFSMIASFLEMGGYSGSNSKLDKGKGV